LMREEVIYLFVFDLFCNFFSLEKSGDAVLKEDDSSLVLE
jgi:hypothetical protein